MSRGNVIGDLEDAEQLLRRIASHPKMLQSADRDLRQLAAQAGAAANDVDQAISEVRRHWKAS